MFKDATKVVVRPGHVITEGMWRADYKTKDGVGVTTVFMDNAKGTKYGVCYWSGYRGE